MTDRALSDELIVKVRFLRKLRRMSAQSLADRMTEQGFEITRGALANLESGRKKDVSVDFADHAARALDTTLIRLLTESAECPSCTGTPPSGFTCNTCGESS